MGFLEVGVGALGAVEEILVDVLGGVFDAGVGVGVGHFSFAAVCAGQVALPYAG